MASTTTDFISITVEVSSQGGNKTADLNATSLSMTVGELKTKLKVRANSRFGRSHQVGSWDNRRSLLDYFVKDGESFLCVIQCILEEGQHSFDNYNK